MIAAYVAAHPSFVQHSTYFLNEMLRGNAAAAHGIHMQNNIDPKNTAVNPRTINPNNLNSSRSTTLNTRKWSGSGFTREEMRQIVAEQID